LHMRQPCPLYCLDTAVTTNHQGCPTLSRGFCETEWGF
jgi:hypothetical protein